MYVDENGKVFPDGMDLNWVPDLCDGYWDDRRDPKWAHPETREVFYGVPIDSSEGLAMMVEATISREERIKIKEEWIKKYMGDAAMLDENLSDEDSAVETTIHTIKGLKEGDPDLKIILGKPKDAKKKKLKVLFAFGQAAMVMNDATTYEGRFKPYCEKMGVAVVFPLARTGLEACYPEPLDDYQAAYQWVLDHGNELGLNPKHIVVMGISGGGYAAAAFAFRCKRLGWTPKGALLINPVMGDDLHYPSNKIVAGSWDGMNVQRSFKVIVKPGNSNSPFVSPEIIPSRASVKDCKGLCPIYIHANEIDACRDASIDFVNKCLEAKGFAQIHVWGGVPHGAQMTGNYRLQKLAQEIMDVELMDMFEYDLRRPWVMEMD